jgi:hypothetical protein
LAQNSHAYTTKPYEDFRQVKSLKKCDLGSSFGDDIFCSSETKHDRIKYAKNTVVSFDEQITGTKATTPKKTVLGSSPGKVYRNFKSNNGRRTYLRVAWFVSAGRLQEQKLQTRKKCFGYQFS